MTRELLINLVYIVSALLFIMGLKKLSSPATARRGNALSALGMFLAVAATLIDQQILSYQWILVGILIGSVVGVVSARFISMTAMPEMVALLNGFAVI